MSREDAYKAVQRNAMPVWLEGKDFLTLLKADDAVTSLLDANLHSKPCSILATIPSMWTRFSNGCSAIS